MIVTTFLKSLSRRKTLFSIGNENFLKKTFNTYDLISLGVGSTLGVGLYILPGSVVKNVTGPAIVFSFLIAAIISVLAGLCFAEFGAYSPSSGSIYSYCYATLGEFFAFIMGWNLLSQYIIGTASVVKALSIYIDSYMNNTIETHLREIYEIDVPYLSQYFDVLALLICILIAIALSFGLTESVLINNILTSVNVSLVLFFVIIGLPKINFSNWQLPPPSNISFNAGNGGFLPYGLTGVIQGAGVCFYGFIGFDSIATTGGEVKMPEKTFPIAIITTLAIVFAAYFSISTVLTLLVPYYLQDETAPLSYAFQYIGYNWAEWILNIGSLFGLCTALLGSFFPVSRILFAMSNDGLIFRSFSIINKKYNTPVIGTLCSGIITGIIAAIFDVDHLINLNSIGTLLSYTTIAICVIILRYAERYYDNISESNPLLIIEEKKILRQCELSYQRQKTNQIQINHTVSINVAIYCN
ncbi:hypothetical protein PGB90_009199 [Kerria lacca]